MKSSLKITHFPHKPQNAWTTCEFSICYKMILWFFTRFIRELYSFLWLLLPKMKVFPLISGLLLFSKKYLEIKCTKQLINNGIWVLCRWFPHISPVRIFISGTIFPIIREITPMIFLNNFRVKLRIDRNFCLVHEEITSIRLYTPCNPHSGLRKVVYNLIEVISNEPNK